MAIALWGFFVCSGEKESPQMIDMLLSRPANAADL